MLCENIYVIQDMLFDLAGAAGLEDKRTKMGTGQHINATEDRAGVGSTCFEFSPTLYDINNIPTFCICISSYAHCPALS